jgi:hypothetical protein
MGIAMQEIGELDVVAFTQALGRWPAGTTGAVVYDSGEIKTIEIVNDQGETLGLPDAPTDKLELIWKFRGKVAHNEAPCQ